jgi:NitT/TauT family transport system ATP-binding protein
MAPQDPGADPSNLWGNAREGSGLQEILVATETEAAVQMRGLARSFGPVEALAGVDLDVAPGKIVGIVGPSGCGKSTLLELIAGLQQPNSGTVASPPASYMPQKDLLLPWRDALGNAALSLEAGGSGRREARRRAAPLFERFGLGGFERTPPYELSGGMRQRVAFLRTLLPGRPVLLLDEPFASLDSLTRGEMQAWLADALEAEPRTTLFVTHDVEEALYLGDRVVVLSARPGRVVAELEVPIPRPRPRRETVTDPAFVELRERALEALGC